MRNTIQILALAALFSSTTASATVYYIAPTGNDANNGTSQSTPWKTIARVQQLSATAVAGDQFLFQRGGTYVGQLSWNSSGTAAANIVFGAYGTGALPVINGATTVTGWTVHSGNIYKASVPQGVKYVFVNGALQTLARYPNTGWLRVNTSNSTSLTSTSITQANGHWNGASMVLRSTNWCYENKVISSHTGTTLNFPSLTYYAGNYNWGFFLCNKLSELDSPGEWYHDATTGTLYLWTPTGANPSTLTVEASIHQHGVKVEWQRARITVQDLLFRGQALSGVDVAGPNVTVTGCTFEKLYEGIRSYSNNSVYSNNTFQNTYGAGAWILDNGSIVSGSTFTNIAMIAGMGEPAFGYFGMHVAGGTNTVRDNRVNYTGNSGIFVGETTLVERNVVSNFCATLNDGGGIYWDNANGMVVQDNIIRDAIGNIESAATNFSSVNGVIAPGIYFGNAVITNNIIQRNTVSNCHIGILMDHTMVTAGNQVKNNVLFNNRTQLHLSDRSNTNGPGAAAPYYVPSYNTVISGNQLYSLSPDQLCIEMFNCYQQGNVDYGVFSNNKLYNPYNELSIRNWNIGTTSGMKTYTLERWQAERAEEAGSTRSPLRSALYSTTSELTSNLVLNGNFASTVTGWGGWPTNAQVTRDLTYLDAGALKATLPNSSQSASFYMTNPDLFSMQNGSWYRLRCSVQSNAHGTVNAAVKGVSQLSSGYSIFARDIPFDTQRRDLEIYFQSNLAEQAKTMFTSTIAEPTYWLDNVELHRVSVAPKPASGDHMLLSNEQATSQSFALPAGCWADMNGTLLSGPQTVGAYASKIIYRVPGTGCSSPTATTVGAKVLLSGPLNWTTGLMSENLRAQNLIPTAEPYTALGFTLENTGATLATSLLSTTGSQAIVDWVLIELRNNDAGNTVAARRAALVRSNGQVIAPNGDAQMAFNVDPVGKRMVVRHRNHLAAMATAPITSNGQVIDFTSASTALYGTNALKVIGSYRGLWAGDVNTNGVVVYTGSANDRDAVLTTIGGVIVTNVVQGYSRSDVNLDGSVKYSGSANDRDVILDAIGGVIPTFTRAAQLP